MEYTVEYGKGYSGKKGIKPWVAAIRGSSKEYVLDRAFVEPTKIDRESLTSPKTMVTLTFELTPGVYELSEKGNRSFVMVWEQNGQSKWGDINDDRVKAIIALLDTGKSFEEARLATRPKPKPVAATEGQ